MISASIAFSFYQIIITSSYRCNLGCYGQLTLLGIMRTWFLPAYLSVICCGGRLVQLICELMTKGVLCVAIYINGDFNKYGPLFAVGIGLTIIMWEIYMHYVFLLQLNGFQQREMVMTVVSEKEVYLLKYSSAFSCVWF
jgi:hypothetical protein